MSGRGDLEPRDLRPHILLVGAVLLVLIRWLSVSQVVSRTPKTIQALCPLAGSQVEPATRADQERFVSKKIRFILQQQLNVNQSSAAELALVPGIGPALARKIVLDRQRHGPFYSPTDLVRVKGIGLFKAHQIGGFLLFRSNHGSSP